MKTAVITGSTRGLGFEMAKLFCLRDWNVVVNGVNPERLANAVAALKDLGGKGEIELSEKTKKVYNILGDYPDVVAKFLVDGMLANTKNNAQIAWLTGRKATWRFVTAGFRKKDYFADEKRDRKQ